MRSVPAGSFARISSPAALWRAWCEHARGKSRRPAVAAFALDIDRHVFALARDLLADRYRPGRYHQHVVRDPKLRLISAPSLRDRVLHQAIVTELGEHFTRSYIDDSFACLPARGPQRAVLRHLALTRRHRFRLALDVSRYFPSIDHEAVQGILRRRIRDRRTLTLLAHLLQHGAGVYRTNLAREILGELGPPGRGLPIGSCLSQWLANLYLDGVDQFIKRTLKVRAYLRYMDDMVLFADDRDQLADARTAVTAWLTEHRRLTLGPSHIVDARAPCTFLGYRISPSGLSPGKKMRRRLPSRVRASEQGSTGPPVKAGGAQHEHSESRSPNPGPRA